MRQLTALLIEDNPADAVAVKRLLKRDDSLPYRVLLADSLKTGLAEIEDGNVIDVILLDLSLPDAHQLEAVSKMARHAPELPVVVLTGLSDEQLAVDAVNAGADDYLVKGELNANMLSRSIRYSIERKRSKIELKNANAELEARVEQRTAQLIKLQEASRQQQEELAHVDRLHTLGEMASGLAHELNQPLMAIVCFCSSALQRLAKSPTADSEITALLQDISAEARKSGEIIKRLRRMVGKRAPQRSAVDLDELVEETIAFLQHQLSNSSVTVELKRTKDLPLVSVDRVQIQQVLVNLLTNAIQAMAADNAEISERQICIATAYSPNRKDIDIDVTNSGPTMTQEELDRLFNPFYSTKKEGLGLGLSISRNIVESHNGTLTVLPQTATGTTFRISLVCE